uniref:Uncharacterized protein n=1 Tax=Craspedostauros australis TaxID=1486917 RepID=A0A7R9ZKY1_9STRA|mmetsp:Transcript_1712/g.4713  ORF Transcript_1712/g.4713 Transcript_1712/m.4713 type:complete len:179 (+) Transcript_1712:209-745(+)
MRTDKAVMVRNKNGELVCCNGAPVLMKQVDDAFLASLPDSELEACQMCLFREWRQGDVIYMNHPSHEEEEEEGKKHTPSRSASSYRWTCASCAKEQGVSMPARSHRNMTQLPIRASLLENPPRPMKRVVTPTKKGAVPIPPTYVATKETTTAVAKNGESCVVGSTNVLMDVVSCMCLF